jgi:hypothetical protein
MIINKGWFFLFLLFVVLIGLNWIGNEGIGNEGVGLQPSGFCATSPCLLFKPQDVNTLWTKLQSSQFFSRIPTTVSVNTNFINWATTSNNQVIENAAIHCVLNPNQGPGTSSCNSAKNSLMWAVNNIGPNGQAVFASDFTTSGHGVTGGGRILTLMEAFDWGRAKGIFSTSEEAAVVNWIEYMVSRIDSAYNIQNSGGNAALDNYDVPLATAGYFMYVMLDGNDYTTISSTTVQNKINFYVDAIRKGAHDFDSFPVEGLNYHVYTRPSLTRAALTAEANGQYLDILDQSLETGLVVGDLYMGSGSGMPNCPPGPVPFTTLAEQGKWFMYDVEANPCEKGLRGFTLDYLVGLGRLYQTDSGKAVRGISRVFEVDNILGSSTYRSDLISSTSPALMAALFYDDTILYFTNLDVGGYLPAGFHKDQKNDAPPNAQYNGWDLDGDGGLFMAFNKLKGVGRTGVLFMNRDGYMQHLHGSESGSVEMYAGSFPVEVSPGRGSLSSPGSRLVDHNIFLTNGAGSGTFNYYNPSSLGSSQNNYEGKYNYHLEGFFVSGAEAENKRIWNMDVANRFVGMVSEPDDISYVIEYVETDLFSGTGITKRSHSLVQAVPVVPGVGQTVGNGFEVVYQGNRGIKRFFEPVNPTIILPSTPYATLQKIVYDNQATMVYSGTEIDWLYITELIPSGNNRNTPNLVTLPVSFGEGYGGVIDWDSNGLNKGFKDFIVARRHDSNSLNLVSAEIQINTDARIVLVRKDNSGNIMKYGVFDATTLNVDGVQLLSSIDRVSVSVFPGIQVEAVGTPNNPSTTSPQLSVFAPVGWEVMPGPATSEVIFNGGSYVYSTSSGAQGGDVVALGGVVQIPNAPTGLSAGYS